MIEHRRRPKRVMGSTVAEDGPVGRARRPGWTVGTRTALEGSGLAGPSGMEAVPGLVHRPGAGTAHRMEEPNDPLDESQVSRETADSLARLRGAGRPRSADVVRSIGAVDRTASPALLQALASTPAPAPATIRRQYTPTPADEQDFGAIANKWPDAEPVGARALAVKWCRSHAQFLSLVNNFSWPEFRALAKKYASGEAVPTKAGAIREKMQKEMQAELQQIAAAKAAAWTAQVDHYRETGAPGPAMNYDLFLQKNILKVAHRSTFRTMDEKSQKGPNGSGPYTRNFSAEVGGVGAWWEIHVHYADNGSPQKAHAKLIKDRHSKVHVADLKLASKVIGETTKKIDATIDTTERARTDW